ncbi:hypothetical protein ACL02U_09805 [Streptomyces sp. MS06]|uniref:hypothetical protein n=1 Tax=Streptomyces sp. MS06 TaxID=3385974 RepID=UPI0039A17F36
MTEENTLNTAERSMQMRIAAYKSWARTTDRSARTAKARKASHHDRFVAQARELHPTGTEKQIADAAEALKSAHYRELALKSAQARRIRSEEARAAKARRIERVLSDADNSAA